MPRRSLMNIRLSQAAEIYFDRTLWGGFSARFETQQIALARLSVLPCDPLGYHRARDLFLPASEPDRKSYIEETLRRGHALIRTFKAKLIAGEIEATGIPSHLDERVSITAAEWHELWPEFIEERAMGASRFEAVFLSDTTNPAILTEAIRCRMIDWLVDQARIRSSTKRASLLLDAKAKFGLEFTNQIFRAAYSAAFKKPRGRPKS